MGVVVHAEYKFAERRKAAELARLPPPPADPRLARLQALRDKNKK